MLIGTFDEAAASSSVPCDATCGSQEAHAWVTQAMRGASSALEKIFRGPGSVIRAGGPGGLVDPNHRLTIFVEKSRKTREEGFCRDGRNGDIAPMRRAPVLPPSQQACRHPPFGSTI